MYEWIKHFDYDCIVIATKSDKLSNNELGKSKKIIKETLGLGSTDKFYFFSSLNKKGKDELINIFLKIYQKRQSQFNKKATCERVVFFIGEKDKKIIGWKWKIVSNENKENSI